MPAWLVTGASGFLGRHVLAALDEWKSPDVHVIASGRAHPSDQTPLTFLEVDLNDSRSVKTAIATCAPEVVLHLAGRTPPAEADALYRDNTLATVHLLDA